MKINKYKFQNKLKMLSSTQEISMVTKKKLAKLLIHSGEVEIQIEFSRQNLCKAAAFEPYAAF